MRSKRVPDRVHVVRPPEQDGYTPQQSSSSGYSVEIVRMLAQISDKLKRSEAERYELLGELREYRKSLKDLEEKAENSEKAYLAIEHKVQTTGSVDTESHQRQAKFEKALRATEDKLVKSIAGQALIDKRLKDTEDKQTAIDQRLDQSIAEQIKLDRQLELTSQDKARVLRKIERLEEMVTDTQDTLRAKAMVLLTDQSATAQTALKAMPAWGEGDAAKNISEEHDGPWWQKNFNVQSIGMASMIVAALLGGWTINQLQQPEVPQIAVLEGGGLARLNLNENRWEPVIQNNGSAASSSSSTSSATPSSNVSRDVSDMSSATPSVQPAAATNDLPDDVTAYSDDQLLAALNDDPEQLASQLNDIEPSSTQAEQPVEEKLAPVETQAAATPVKTETLKNFDKIAFIQDPKVKSVVEAERGSASLSSRMQADAALPPAVKSIETKAFSGNAEAQHDLAAIYTAGHGGVDQDFEKAAFWFREASEQGIGNARYNLGVLYHQGLGTSRDLSRALYWYREAAKVNHAEAQYNLGIAHIEGIGTNYDPRLAAAFFERAANNGIMEAAYNLGLIYENGLLGEAKPDEALYWYKKAADAGSEDAKSALEQLTKNLQIGMSDVDNLVARMDKINQSAQQRTSSSSSNSQESVANQKRALVAQIQEYLMLTGAYSGPADGLNGPNTASAIRTYQARNSLKVTGQATSGLLNHMVGGAVDRVDNE